MNVYIAHAYGGNDEKRRQAAAFYAEAARRSFIIPLAPWIAVTLAWDESKREEGMKINQRHIPYCQELWVCGEELSGGVMQEIGWAQDHKLRIRYFPTLAALIAHET